MYKNAMMLSVLFCNITFTSQTSKHNQSRIDPIQNCKATIALYLEKKSHHLELFKDALKKNDSINITKNSHSVAFYGLKIVNCQTELKRLEQQQRVRLKNGARFTSYNDFISYEVE